MSTASQSQQTVIDRRILRALAGVRRNAQEGELPLFAWTLGLSRSVLLALIAEHYFPEIIHLHRLTEDQYNRLRQNVPAEFEALVVLMTRLRSTTTDEPQAEWLARVVAAACFGERHLWEDLGLADRDELSQLLERYFEPLYSRNQKSLRWKRFLFAELGASTGNPALHPPGCSSCEQFSICFADESTERHLNAHGDKR